MKQVILIALFALMSAGSFAAHAEVDSDLKKHEAVVDTADKDCLCDHQAGVALMADTAYRVKKPVDPKAKAIKNIQ